MAVTSMPSRSRTYGLNYGFESGHRRGLLNAGAKRININIVANGQRGHTRRLARRECSTEAVQRSSTCRSKSRRC